MATSSFSNTLPLSESSWQSVGLSTLKGASIGAVAGSVANAFVNFVSSYKKRSIVDYFKKNAVYSISGAALAGALGGGIYEYFHTPEKHYEYAKKEIAKIEQDSAVYVLYNFKPADWVSKLRQLWFNSSYPLASAHSWLSTLHGKLVKIKNSASEAMVIEDAVVRQECEEIIIYADIILSLMQEGMLTLTAQPTYAAEYAAKMQEAAAAAAARAALYQSMSLSNQWGSHTHYVYHVRA